MPHGWNATMIGSAGVTLLLVAFFLNLMKAMRSDGWLYLFMNLVGASMSCYSSYLIRFMPFVVLEGTWAGGPDRKFRVFSLVGATPPEPPGGGAPIRALIEADAP